jgi:hypothetical protein
MRCHPSEEVESEHVSGSAGLAEVPGGSMIRDGVDGAAGALRPRCNVRIRPDLSRPQPGKRLRESGSLTSRTTQDLLSPSMSISSAIATTTGCRLVTPPTLHIRCSTPMV